MIAAADEHGRVKLYMVFIGESDDHLIGLKGYEIVAVIVGIDSSLADLRFLVLYGFFIERLSLFHKWKTDQFLVLCRSMSTILVLIRGPCHSLMSLPSYSLGSS